jgi:hypothetical protein
MQPLALQCNAVQCGGAGSLQSCNVQRSVARLTALAEGDFVSGPLARAVGEAALEFALVLRRYGLSFRV